MSGLRQSEAGHTTISSNCLCINVILNSDGPSGKKKRRQNIKGHGLRHVPVRLVPSPRYLPNSNDYSAPKAWHAATVLKAATGGVESGWNRTTASASEQ